MADFQDDNQDDRSLLYQYFGTHSPYWRLASDSDAFELSAIKGAANIATALSPEQAAAIRDLTGITSSLRIEVKLYGEPIGLHLVGRKINPKEWAGTASAYSDTESVARTWSRACPSPRPWCRRPTRSSSSSTSTAGCSASTS